MDVIWDVRRGVDTYRRIQDGRLKRWISTGKFKRGEVLVWRSGLSGWRRPEDLHELQPLFEARASPPETDKEERAAEPKRGVRTVLIIDDEPDLCFLLSTALAERGYAVTVAQTARRGVAALKRERPDLVLLDLRLPDGDGLKILPKIRQRSPESAVLIISAYGNNQTIAEAARRGASGFINKPFTAEEILGRIATASR